MAKKTTNKGSKSKDKGRPAPKKAAKARPKAPQKAVRKPDKKPLAKPARAASTKADKKGLAKANPASKGGKRSGQASSAAGSADEARRKLGIRGAAPWAARHAAKHAAEARARAAEPPPPGSARATIRIPTGAEEIKAKIALLHNAISEIRTLRKNLAHNFFDVGSVLKDIQIRKLYEARGFGSFEAFLDREMDIGKITGLRLVRMVEVFHREAAVEYGLDRMMYVMAILEAPDKPVPMMQSPASQPTKVVLPLRPPLPAKK
ncbi:MAG TPA: hypothetical protein PLI95_24040 [Polyangiaceae bacterium]|nr:hypothetical protein [Polyangiaceae bacterium]